MGSLSPSRIGVMRGPLSAVSMPTLLEQERSSPGTPSGARDQPFLASSTGPRTVGRLVARVTIVRIVVIGSGHVGSFLVPRLVRAGHEVINLARGARSPYVDDETWSEVEQISVDRAAEDAAGTFGERVAELEAEVVVDMICFTPDSATALVEALRGRSGHLIHCGTIWRYGASVKQPMREDDTSPPFGEYGKQKAAIAELLAAETRSGGLVTTVLQPGHISGPGWAPIGPLGNLDPAVWYSLSAGQEIAVPGLGTELLHHVHADDVAQAFQLAVEHRDGRRRVVQRGRAVGADGPRLPCDRRRLVRKDRQHPLGELGRVQVRHHRGIRRLQLAAPVAQPVRLDRESAHAARLRPDLRTGSRGTRRHPLADRPCSARGGQPPGRLTTSRLLSSLPMLAGHALRPPARTSPGSPPHRQSLLRGVTSDAAKDGRSAVTDVQLGTGVRAYGRLLRHGPASRPFAFAALARLTLAMVPLGILILVEQERQAYAIAGVVSGAYAIGAAVGTPVWGRLMDRFGQVAVLLPTAVTSAALLVGLALATTNGAPDRALIAIAAGVGLSYPAISPALRSSFRIVLPDPQARRVAFALDATSVELAFVCGPLLLSALLLPRIPLLPPWSPPA